MGAGRPAASCTHAVQRYCLKQAIILIINAERCVLASTEATWRTRNTRTRETPPDDPQCSKSTCSKSKFRNAGNSRQEPIMVRRAMLCNVMSAFRKHLVKELYSSLMPSYKRSVGKLTQSEFERGLPSELHQHLAISSSVGVFRLKSHGTLKVEKALSIQETSPRLTSPKVARSISRLYVDLGESEALYHFRGISR